jgi:hypothetical protein
VGPDSTVLQAGSSHRNKYEALPLNVSGHAVDAALKIRDRSIVKNAISAENFSDKKLY